MVVDCGSLLNPQNGAVNTSGTTLNSVANYSCNEGYEINGTMTRTCGDDGNWSMVEPNCDCRFYHTSVTPYTLNMFEVRSLVT